MDDLPKLTPKQRQFADAYLGECRFNATHAAVAAGFSEKSAATIGWRLLRNVEVRAYVDAILDANTLSAQAVLAELTDVARAEWRDFVSVRTNREGEVIETRMDLRSKVDALELLGKHHKLFTDKHEVTSEVLIREYADGEN